jgi:peptidoglycan/xylan/chitin deacetylase (PgdA/CDA1 family)
MLTVSNYHYIRPNFDAPFSSIFGMTPRQFEKQLRLLKNEADFIHPKDLVSNYENVLSSKSNYYLVTFDDGLKEQYQYALPILDQLDIPAIFFVNSINCQEKKVTTVHKIHLLRSVLRSEIILNEVHQLTKFSLSETEKVHAKSVYRYDENDAAALKYLLNFKMSFDEQERFVALLFQDKFDENEVLASLYMTKEMIMDLAQRGLLGSHTHHHYPLGLLPQKEIEFELKNSKDYLENLTNTNVDIVSYPYGSKEACTDLVATLAEKADYKLGFTTQRGSNSSSDNALLLNRYDCNDLPGGKSYDPKFFV